MATNKTRATGTSSNHSVKEIQEWYEKNKNKIENYAKAVDSFVNLRDVTKAIKTRTINTVDKEVLKSYIKNIGSNEKQLRSVARYLYYRSNILFRLTNFYADMWCLNCRKVTPQYNILNNNDPNAMKKSYEDTLKQLDIMNMQANMVGRLINVYLQDVSYAICYKDDTGMFFYELDPNECIIDGEYYTGDYSFAIDMSKWKTSQRQKIIEFLGSPLKEMYAEYQKNTQNKYIHCPDEYASVFKFRTDTWDTCIPPLLPIFLSLTNLEDLVDIQAEADELSIYKLIYMPLKILSGSKDPDNFEINPAIAKEYFDKLIEDAVPNNVGAAMVPGDELKVIDFQKTVDSDTNSVEKSSNQILQTAGGGAVINANNITSNAAFNAWLKYETEFAMSTLMPQVNGFVNRMLTYSISKPAKVEHFEVSIYTKDDLADKLLNSCEYSYPNRIAYNTLLGISERETLAMLYFENEVLDLPNKMKYPLMSSHTTSGKEDGGAPTKDASQLSPEGDRSRNR